LKVWILTKEGDTLKVFLKKKNIVRTLSKTFSGYLQKTKKKKDKRGSDILLYQRKETWGKTGPIPSKLKFSLHKRK